MSMRCSTPRLRRASAPSSRDIRWAAWRSPPGRTVTATRSTSRADAVALINTTTGDLLREVRLLPVPAPFAAVRVLGGRALINIFGSFTVPPAVRRASREMISMLAVGADADRAVGALIYELFSATSPAGRGGCGKALVEAMGRRHIDLSGLTVPDAGHRQPARPADAAGPVSANRRCRTELGWSGRVAGRSLLDAGTAAGGQPGTARPRRVSEPRAYRAAHKRA